jgi:hypothetical protein
MKTSIVSLFLAICLTSKSYSQTTDSIRLEVVKARSNQDRTYYWFKDGNGNKYYTVCSCEQRHKKGEFVMISKKDIGFIEPKNY